ncbi:hypothetical protein FB451DRAFT_1251074 [Mycena latifolia]|nr:hypothetical protein FB451DRAFT_1251074 [Mycena latifolia]
MTTCTPATITWIALPGTLKINLTITNAGVSQSPPSSSASDISTPLSHSATPLSSEFASVSDISVLSSAAFAPLPSDESVPSSAAFAPLPSDESVPSSAAPFNPASSASAFSFPGIPASSASRSFSSAAHSGRVLHRSHRYVRGTITQEIANNIDGSTGTFTWASVNVSAGWYCVLCRERGRYLLSRHSV